MKKLLALLLSLALVFSLWGCKAEKDSGSKKDGKETEKTEATGDTEETEDTQAEDTQPEETAPDEPGSNGPSKPVEEKTSTPILYQVSDEDGNIVYLFGSIHVGIDEMYPLPDYVLDAYDESDALAVECDVIAEAEDEELLMEILSMMVLTDGTKITDYISEECYERAVEIIKENDIYVDAFELYKPILWESLISNYMTDKAGTDSDMGVDMYFLTDAYETGKTIYEIESGMEQYTMLANFSMDLQVLLLEDAVAGYDDPEYCEMLLDMCRAWAAGDEDALMDEVDADYSDLTEEELVLLDEYNTAMEGMRNVNMTRYAMDAMESGETVFIVVGAAHVLGDDGMAAALEEAGYTVTRVQ